MFANMKNFKLIIGIFATLIITKVESHPLPLETSEYEDYTKHLDRIMKVLQPYNLFNATKNIIMNEFEDYFEGSLKEQFISALIEHRPYFDESETYIICGFDYHPKSAEIVEIIDQMINLTKNITDQEFDKALENIKAFGPLLINFYQFHLDVEESHALTKANLKVKLSEFLD